MNVIVFCGPTLQHREVSGILPEALVFGPAACGDVYRASCKDPDFIGLIDGYFDHRLAVWHKEVLWALSRGQCVYGAASMGALRAAELADMGMIGVGRVFEQYVSGELEDDDEVALIHEPEDAGYRPRSEAMVNLRATLAHASSRGIISESSQQILVSFAKELFYPERSYAALLDAAPRLGVPSSQIAGLRRLIELDGAVNQKRLDARAMLERMRQDAGLPEVSARCRATFRFARTNAWQVFKEKLDAEATSVSVDTADSTSESPATDGLSLERLQESEPDLAMRIWIDALERALALVLADETDAAPDAPTMQGESEAFRRERDLLSQDEAETWMKENELDLGSFSTLIYDEVLVRRFRESARQLGFRQLANALRISSEYVRWRAR